MGEGGRKRKNMTQTDAVSPPLIGFSKLTTTSCRVWLTFERRLLERRIPPNAPDFLSLSSETSGYAFFSEDNGDRGFWRLRGEEGGEEEAEEDDEENERSSSSMLFVEEDISSADEKGRFPRDKERLREVDGLRRSTRRCKSREIRQRGSKARQIWRAIAWLSRWIDPSTCTYKNSDGPKEWAGRHSEAEEVDDCVVSRILSNATRSNFFFNYYFEESENV